MLPVKITRSKTLALIWREKGSWFEVLFLQLFWHQLIWKGRKNPKKSFCFAFMPSRNQIYFTWIFLIIVFTFFVKVENLIILERFTLFCSRISILQNRMYYLKELFTFLMISSFHMGAGKFSFPFHYTCLQYQATNTFLLAFVHNKYRQICS